MKKINSWYVFYELWFHKDYEDEDDIESQRYNESKHLRKKTDKPKTWSNKIWRSIILFTSMMTIALTLLTYLELYIGVSNIARPVQTVFASSEGPPAEMYPDYMGQYNILRDVYRHDRAVYKHVDRGDRFIFYNGSHIGVY